MGEEKTSLGRIHISPNAIVTIAYHATLESYGVVGLAPMNIADGIVKSITLSLRAGSRFVTMARILTSRSTSLWNMEHASIQ